MKSAKTVSREKASLGTRLFVHGWMVLVVGTIALTILFVIGLGLSGGPRGLLFGSGKGPTDARASLYVATPFAWKDGHFIGLLGFTAEQLNRIRQGHDFRKIVYVDANVESTGRRVVSVNAIDEFTWGAAALSARTDRCYLILVKLNPEMPRYGAEKYGWLPRGQACVGVAATRDSVTSDEWPSSD